MKFVFLRHLLPGGLRRGLRPTWDRLLRREAVSADRGLYDELIRPGALVFDVGANIGVKTGVFLKLGARVVAVEPNPECADLVESDHRHSVSNGNLTIVRAAVGSDRGRLTLRLFEGANSISSGSESFVKAALEAGQRNGGSIEVEQVTLEDLVARFGLPDFIKVDVEGMDAEVLRGLKSRPRLLSFEYNLNPRVWPNTLRCVDEVRRLGFSEAQFSDPDHPDERSGRWALLDGLVDALQRRSGGVEIWGDVFVR